MKTADEMFEELGFIKYINDDCEMYMKGLYMVTFILSNKSFITEYRYGDYNFPKVRAFEIEMNVLQAINKKVEELRMELEEAIKRARHLAKVSECGAYEYPDNEKMFLEDSIALHMIADEVEKLNKTILNKDECFKNIIGLGFDYDNFYNSETKKGNIEDMAGLIDDMVDIANDGLQGINSWEKETKNIANTDNTVVLKVKIQEKIDKLERGLDFYAGREHAE